jgi:mannosyl-oligosaccharide alpha-1,2-mannosidase
MLSIHVTRIRRSYTRMVRQHKRKLTWLLCGVLTLGTYYMWSAGPLDPLAVPFEQHGVYMNERRSQIPLKSRQSYDWRKAPFVKKISSYIQLPADTPRKLPRVQFSFKSETRSQREERDSRKLAVRDELGKLPSVCMGTR